MASRSTLCYKVLLTLALALASSGLFVPERMELAGAKPESSDRQRRKHFSEFAELDADAYRTAEELIQQEALVSKLALVEQRMRNLTLVIQDAMELLEQSNPDIVVGATEKMKAAVSGPNTTKTRVGKDYSTARSISKILGTISSLNHRRPAGAESEVERAVGFTASSLSTTLASFAGAMQDAADDLLASGSKPFFSRPQSDAADFLAKQEGSAAHFLKLLGTEDDMLNLRSWGLAWYHAMQASVYQPGKCWTPAPDSSTTSATSNATTWYEAWTASAEFPKSFKDMRSKGALVMPYLCSIFDQPICGSFLNFARLGHMAHLMARQHLLKRHGKTGACEGMLVSEFLEVNVPTPVTDPALHAAFTLKRVSESTASLKSLLHALRPKDKIDLKNVLLVDTLWGYVKSLGVLGDVTSMLGVGNARPTHTWWIILTSEYVFSVLL